jgi:Sec-independent protein secretion pathway component TatC
MIAMAIPLMALYEIAVFAVRILERRRTKAQAAKDAADA